MTEGNGVEIAREISLEAQLLWRQRHLLASADETNIELGDLNREAKAGEPVESGDQLCGRGKVAVKKVPHHSYPVDGNSLRQEPADEALIACAPLTAVGKNVAFVNVEPGMGCGCTGEAEEIRVEPKS